MSESFKPPEFSYHIRSGLSGITLGLVLLLAVEGFAVHVLLSMWNPWVAWAFTSTTAYSAVWLVLQSRACARRPILVTDDHLVLHSGRRAPIEIPRAEVVAVYVDDPEGFVGAIESSD